MRDRDVATVKARRINLGRKPGGERDQRLRQRMAQRAEAGGSSSRKAEYRDAFCSKASQRVKRAGCVGNQQVEAAPGSDVVAKFRDGERRRLVPQPAKEPGHRWAQAARNKRAGGAAEHEQAELTSGR